MNLVQLRKQGESRAIIISATGTGKTYLSAFDVRQYKPNRMLYIAQQEQILKKRGNHIKKCFVAPMMSLDYFPEQVKSTIVNMCSPLCRPCLGRKFSHNSAKMISIIF